MEIASSATAVLQYSERAINGNLVYSKPFDSESMRYYSTVGNNNCPVLAFDVYWDATTISKPVSQSANLVIYILVNVRGRSSKWNELGIAPYIPSGAPLIDKKIAFERAILLQMFLFLIFKEAFLSSITILTLDGTIFVVQFNTIVCN